MNKNRRHIRSAVSTELQTDTARLQHSAFHETEDRNIIFHADNQITLHERIVAQ